MNIVLRVFLVVVACLALALILRKLRKSEMQVVDSVFWFFFAFSLVVLAVVPNIAYFFPEYLGLIPPRISSSSTLLASWSYVS